MKLAFISVYLFLVLSSVSAQSVFARRNRSGGNIAKRDAMIFKATGGAGGGGNNNNAAADAANNAAAGATDAANNAAANNSSAAGGAAGGDPQTSTTLDPKVIATGFEQNGQNPPVTGWSPCIAIRICSLTLKSQRSSCFADFFEQLYQFLPANVGTISPYQRQASAGGFVQPRSRRFNPPQEQHGVYLDYLPYGRINCAPKPILHHLGDIHKYPIGYLHQCGRHLSCSPPNS